MLSFVLRLLAFFGIGMLIGHFVMNRDWGYFWVAIVVDLLLMVAFATASDQ